MAEVDDTLIRLRNAHRMPVDVDPTGITAQTSALIRDAADEIERLRKLVWGVEERLQEATSKNGDLVSALSWLADSSRYDTTVTSFAQAALDGADLEQARIESCPSEQQESCEISPEAGLNGGPCRCRYPWRT